MPYYQGEKNKFSTREKAGNYRNISLLCSAYKIYAQRCLGTS